MSRTGRDVVGPCLRCDVRTLYRGRAYWLAFLPMVVTVCVALFLGLFVGGMQIVDDWV